MIDQPTTWSRPLGRPLPLVIVTMGSVLKWFVMAMRPEDEYHDKIMCM